MTNIFKLLISFIKTETQTKSFMRATSFQIRVNLVFRSISGFFQDFKYFITAIMALTDGFH